MSKNFKKLCELYHVKNHKLNSPNKFKIHGHQIEVDRPCLKSSHLLDYVSDTVHLSCVIWSIKREIYLSLEVPLGQDFNVFFASSRAWRLSGCWWCWKLTSLVTSFGGAWSWAATGLHGTRLWRNGNGLLAVHLMLHSLGMVPMDFKLIGTI